MKIKVASRLASEQPTVHLPKHDHSANNENFAVCSPRQHSLRSHLGDPRVPSDLLTNTSPSSLRGNCPFVLQKSLVTPVIPLFWFQSEQKFSLLSFNNRVLYFSNPLVASYPIKEWEVHRIKTVLRLFEIINNIFEVNCLVSDQYYFLHRNMLCELYL